MRNNVFGEYFSIISLQAILKVPPRPVDPYGWYVQDPYPFIIPKDRKALIQAQNEYTEKCVESDKNICKIKEEWRRNPESIPSDIRPWMLPATPHFASTTWLSGEHVESSSTEKMEVDDSTKSNAGRCSSRGLRSSFVRPRNAAGRETNFEAFAKSAQSSHDDVKGWLSKKNEQAQDPSRQQSKEQQLGKGHQKGDINDKTTVDQELSSLFAEDAIGTRATKCQRKEKRLPVIASSSDESFVSAESKEDDPDFDLEKPPVTRRKEIMRKTNDDGRGGAKRKTKVRKDSEPMQGVSDIPNIRQRLDQQVVGGSGFYHCLTGKKIEPGELVDSEEKDVKDEHGNDFIKDAREPNEMAPQSQKGGRGKAKKVPQGVVRNVPVQNGQGGKGKGSDAKMTARVMTDQVEMKNGQTNNSSDNENNNNMDSGSVTSGGSEFQPTLSEVISQSHSNVSSPSLEKPSYVWKDWSHLEVLEENGNFLTFIDQTRPEYQGTLPCRVTIDGIVYTTGVIEDNGESHGLMRLYPNTPDVSVLGRPSIHQRESGGTEFETVARQVKTGLEDRGKTPAKDICILEDVSEIPGSQEESPNVLRKR